MQDKQNERAQDATPEAAESGSTRRDFLKVAGATALGGVLAAGIAAPEAHAAQNAGGGTKMAGPLPVPKADTKKLMGGKYPKAPTMAKSRVIGANDRINLAIVGIGGMGGGHLNNFTREAQDRNCYVTGVCDVYQPRLDRAKNVATERGNGSSVQADKDYRRILENKDIDAVLIATPEHWHGEVACHAMEAGKHVYIQKPMTRYLDEAFQVYDTAKRTGRVVQVGSQGCSDFRWHTAGKAVRDGRIGEIVMGQSSYTRNSAGGEWNYPIDAGANAENLDWKMWLGSAPDRPWSTSGGAGGGEQPLRDDAASRFFRYRKYWDYSGGILGDLMPHRLHPFLIASGNPEYPTRVMSVGTRLGKDREVDDNIQVIAEFPSGWSMLFVGSTVNEQGLTDMIRGHKGTVYFGQGVEVRPERDWAEELEGGSIELLGPTGEPHERHERNWLDCIRTGKTPNCNIDLATKVQVIISLAEMSSRMNKAMLFDEKTRTYKAG